MAPGPPAPLRPARRPLGQLGCGPCHPHLMWTCGPMVIGGAPVPWSSSLGRAGPRRPTMTGGPCA
eukprot:9786023-Alexandrium_andersonii.AAC.1